MDVDNKNFTSGDLQDHLNVYYKLLFPFKLFYKWLSYGENQKYFSHREFSFTLIGDVYIRFLCFNNCAEFRDAVIQKKPEKIDLGAVYSVHPSESKKRLVSCVPVERELIFDIDMNDYDDVRTCCKGADICEKCWPFLVVAAKILHRVLTKDFGFKNILLVYSGRRGIHIWVADKRARLLSDRCRSAIVSYISVLEGGAYMTKKVAFDSFKPLHPSIEEAIKIVDKHFMKLIVENQKKLDTKENVQKLLQLCSDQNLKNLLIAKLVDGERVFSKSSEFRWKEFETVVESYYNTPSGPTNRIPIHGRHLIAEVKLQMCYPRLDANVSRGLNHLLKTPFSVHPKTGRVCVPIDINKIDSFDPFKVPIVTDLCNQINQFDAQAKDKEKAKAMQPFEKTDLKESMHLFKRFIDGLEKETVRKRSLQDMEF